MKTDYFKKIDTKEKAYWLGFLYADGYSAVKAPWFVCLQIKDLDHLQKFCKEIEFDNIKEVKGGSYKPDSKQNRISICRKEMCLDLNSLGFQDKSNFPELDEEFYSHFIRGYFDGDGSIYFGKSSSKGKKYTYLKVSIIGECNFMLYLTDFLNQQNITFTWKPSKSNGYTYIEISGGNNLRKLHKYLYKDANDSIFMERKNKWHILYSPFGEKSLERTQNMLETPKALDTSNSNNSKDITMGNQQR